MNQTIFSDEERKIMLQLFEVSMEDNGFDKKDLYGVQRALYMKLGGTIDGGTHEPWMGDDDQ